MRALFLGPWRYWLVWLVVVAALYGLGSISAHVRHFVPFSFAVLALAAAAVGFVLTTYRRGEPVMREPFDKLISDE